MANHYDELEPVLPIDPVLPPLFTPIEIVGLVAVTMVAIGTVAFVIWRKAKRKQ